MSTVFTYFKLLETIEWRDGRRLESGMNLKNRPKFIIYFVFEYLKIN